MKDWKEIERDFDKMQDMSCKPAFKKLPNGYITDERKSVIWNREQVEKNRQKYDNEVARLNTEKNRARDRVYDDIYDKIQSEIGHGIGQRAAAKIWSYAWEKGHSCGFHEVLLELMDIEGLLKEVLNSKNERK